jgi:uncharacterized membrane protein YkoI
MKRLVLDRNDLNTRGKMSQLQHITQRVNYLSMARCNLKDDAGSYLSYGIQPHSFQGMTHARTANFHGCRTLILHHNHLSDEAAKSFADSLSKPNLGLKHLDLSHNDINDAGGELLMTCLTKNTSLISLNLSKNNLKNTTGRVMVQSMKHNETLQVLNVENNEIIPTLIEQVVKTL